MRTNEEWYVSAKIMFAFLHRQGITFSNYNISSEEDIEIVLGDASVRWVTTLLEAFEAGQEFNKWLDNRDDLVDLTENYQLQLDLQDKTRQAVKD